MVSNILLIAKYQESLKNTKDEETIKEIVKVCSNEVDRLKKQGFLDDSSNITPKGKYRAIAMQKGGKTNYLESASKGRLSNAMAMLNGSVKGLKEQISKGVKVVPNFMLHQLIVSCINDLYEMIENVDQEEKPEVAEDFSELE